MRFAPKIIGPTTARSCHLIFIKTGTMVQNKFRSNYKPILLSGIQPTGNLMIGNYIGALKNWVKLQKTHDCLFMLADLHSITVRQNPAGLLRRCLEFAALYLACEIDPVKNTVFIQSHVPGHTQLFWILNCFSHMGELHRMTQFKDKAGRHADKISVGLFNYPVLMAADILLYGTDLVPVGADQKQHLEFTRNIARRFNKRYGKIFNVPEPYIPYSGARIMGLQNPLVKMSKSDENPKNYIAMLDSPDVIYRKIKQAVSDSGKEIRYGFSKPGISNLMTLYSSITGLSMELIQIQYEGQGYAKLKDDLAQVVIEFLNPIQKRYRSISSDPAGLISLLRKGAEDAQKRSTIILDSVFDTLGFIPYEPDRTNFELSIRRAV